jgi:GGDEF domain-containing protein
MALHKMASVLEMALAWRFQAAELRRAAATDPLTGLANRAAC